MLPRKRVRPLDGVTNEIQATGGRIAKTFALLLICAVVGTSGACQTSAEWPGSIRTQDGVTYVDNPAQGLWQEPGSAPFRLELEQVFGVEAEPQDAILGFVVWAAVDDRGNVYTIDRAAEQIVAFGPSGEVLWRAGGSGEGPGEMQGPIGIVWDGSERLYVTNQAGSRLDVWDIGGNYRSGRKLVDFDITTAFVSGFLDARTLVFRSRDGDRRDGASVTVLNIEDAWSKTAELFIPGGLDEEPDRMKGTLIDVRAAKGVIRTGHRIRYLLREFDRRGELVRVIRRDVPELVPTLTYRGTAHNFGEFMAPLELPGGHLLVPHFRALDVESAEQFKQELDRRWDEFLNDEFPRYVSALDLLDPDGRYIGSITDTGFFEGIGRPSVVGPDGRLYTTRIEPFPQIRRYRVVLEQ